MDMNKGIKKIIGGIIDNSDFEIVIYTPTLSTDVMLEMLKENEEVLYEKEISWNISKDGEIMKLSISR